MPKYFARIGETDYEIALEEKRTQLWLDVNDRLVKVDVAAVGAEGGFLSLILNGVSYDVTAERLNGEYYVTVQGEAYSVTVEDERSRAVKSVEVLGGGARGGTVRSVMPGLITQILVAEGDAVEVGTPLAIMEAMKMENEVRSATAGTVAKICVAVGDTVGNHQDLFVIE